MANTSPLFASIKFDAVGRVHRFLLPEGAFESPLRPGDHVVVSRADRRAYDGIVTRTVPQLATRAAPSPRSTDCVLRRAS